MLDGNLIILSLLHFFSFLFCLFSSMRKYITLFYLCSINGIGHSDELLGRDRCKHPTASKRVKWAWPAFWYLNSIVKSEHLPFIIPISSVCVWSCQQLLYAAFTRKLHIPSKGVLTNRPFHKNSWWEFSQFHSLQQKKLRKW